MLIRNTYQELWMKPNFGHCSARSTVGVARLPKYVLFDLLIYACVCMLVMMENFGHYIVTGCLEEVILLFPNLRLQFLCI